MPLPGGPRPQMEELEPLMAAACAFIDVVGCYGAQFTPDQRKRAAAKRAEVQASRARSGAEEATDRANALREKKFLEEQARPRPPPLSLLFYGRLLPSCYYILCSVRRSPSDCFA